MNYYLIVNAAICVLSMAGFVYGLCTSLKKKQPLYYIMIVASVGTTAFTRLLEVLYMWITNEYFNGFHIGILGAVATFLFIFTATYVRSRSGFVILPVKRMVRMTNRITP